MQNPGSAPIDNATETHAAANMAAFAAAVADLLAGDDLTVEEPVRDPERDADGRYGYLLRTADGSEVRVSMPGVPLEQVQAWGTAAPCLQVAGEWWWWPSAVTVAAALMR